MSHVISRSQHVSHFPQQYTTRHQLPRKGSEVAGFGQPHRAAEKCIVCDSQYREASNKACGVGSALTVDASPRLSAAREVVLLRRNPFSYKMSCEKRWRLSETSGVGRVAGLKIEHDRRELPNVGVFRRDAMLSCGMAGWPREQAVMRSDNPCAGLQPRHGPRDIAWPGTATQHHRRDH